MGGTVREYREKVQQLESAVISIAGECMLEHSEEIAQLLVYQQREQSEDSAGQALRPYSRRYALEKAHLTGRGDVTDLDLTGEFHAEMTVRVDGDQYEIESPSTTSDGVLKSAWLNKWNQAKGGAEVMSLTPENKQQVWAIIRDDFMEKVEEVLVID
jgi:hypothetical protein